jgi:hypothetical protein
MKPLLLMFFGALFLFVGCSENTSDKREKMITVDVASKDDVAHIKKMWGVDSPDPNAYLAKKEPGLVILKVSRDRLQPYEQSVQRDWQPVSASTVIQHEQFVVDGSKDTKARFVKWKGEDGRMRYIVLDYSTGLVSYFSLVE